MFSIGRSDRRLNNDTANKQQQQQQPFSNLTNNNGTNHQAFRYGGPRCWTKFRLNRSEVFRCLRE